MNSPWRRFLNWIGWRKDTIICIHKDDTWRWSGHLGARTDGNCDFCGEAIYYEWQNRHFWKKMCNRCMHKEDKVNREAMQGRI